MKDETLDDPLAEKMRRQRYARRLPSHPAAAASPATLVEDSRSACTADGCGCGSGCTLTKLSCGSWRRPTGGATRLGVWARPVAMYEEG